MNFSKGNTYYKESWKSIFPWKRYWCPLGEEIHLDDSLFEKKADGFLATPDDGILGYNSHLKLTSGLLDAPQGCTVLWGDPGMGKSWTISDYVKKSTNANRIYLEFRNIIDFSHFLRLSIDSNQWKEWRDSEEYLELIIDGVDEGLIKIKGFIGALTGSLKYEPINRLHLVLACRSLEWPNSEGERLFEQWQQLDLQTGIYELCPLTKADVQISAKITLADLGVNDASSQFLREIKKHRVEGLAARPLTLKMLLNEYIQSGGMFPTSYRELYFRAVKHLCKETDSSRKERLRDVSSPRLLVNEKERERIAGRIAAMMLICGRSAIVKDSALDSSKTNLSTEEISSGSEFIGNEKWEITIPMIDAVLETPLFWPRTQGVISFFHQTFAECLAANYLNTLQFSQIRSLLFQRDSYGEHVNPQLGELAAWMSCESESLFSYILNHDPEILLRSDVSMIRDGQKAKLVDAIINRAQRNELFDRYGVKRFFHTLIHPDLISQLKKVITAKNNAQDARVLAIEIAESCQLKDLFSYIIDLLKDPEDAQIHLEAAGAISELVGSETIKEVERLFLSNSISHTKRVRFLILVSLIDFGQWTLSDAIPYIDAVLDNHQTSYGYMLANRAKPRDAEDLLKACLHWPACFQSLSRFLSLVQVAHDIALDRINEPIIRALMAKVWWEASRQHLADNFMKGIDRGKCNKDHQTLKTILDTSVELRRAFVDDLVTLIEDDKLIWRILSILKVDDFPFLLEQACYGIESVRKRYAILARDYFHWELYAVYGDEIEQAIYVSEDVSNLLSWIRLWDLNDPQIVKVRKDYYDRIKREEEYQKRMRKEEPPPEKVWAEDLVFFQSTSNPEHWLRLASNLFYHGDRERSDGVNYYDIRSSPGWAFHLNQSRQEIINGARELIIKVPENPKYKIGNQPGFDHSAYLALFLLREEIEKSPILNQAVCNHWLPTIIDESSHDDDCRKEMLAMAYRLDSEKMQSFLIEKLRHGNQQENTYFLMLRDFSICWNKSLSELLSNFIFDEVKSPKNIREVLIQFYELDEIATKEVWHKLRQDERNEARSELFVSATSALVGLSLFESWSDLWPEVSHDIEFGHKVLLSMDYEGVRLLEKKEVQALESQIADLYLFMLRVFPRERDPERVYGRMRNVTNLIRVTQFRDQLLSILSAKGTKEAVDQLGRIMGLVGVNNQDGVRWAQQNALVALRRSQWISPTPEDLVFLISRVESRFINDEEDLLNLVMESLGRFQKNLKGEQHSWIPELWNPEKEKKHWKPMPETHISRIIGNWLDVDLVQKKGIFVHREVQVQYNKRTDLEVSAVTFDKQTNLRPIQIVIEVKGCWHSKVKTAWRDQLQKDYLIKCGRTHGIYLVLWTVCSKWNDPEDSRQCKLKSETWENAVDEVKELVQGCDGTVIKGFVLDATLT